MRRKVQIKESISADGIGVPVISIYISLCDKKQITGSFCKNCQNIELQENNIGYNLSVENAVSIVENKVNSFKKIFGNCEVAFVGGEPLAKVNRDYIYEMAKYFDKKNIKTILYTWRNKKQIKKENINIEYYNRIVCGEYIEELKNESYILGSTNQYIIDNNFNTILKYEGDEIKCT